MASHDAEKTVRRCVESLQGQTLSNFELVAVDAGSSDGTCDQLEALAERDMRIQVVRAGACSREEALDLALERARGAHVLVIDDDGWADREMLERLVDMAGRASLELVVGGFGLALRTRSGRASERSAEAESDRVFATQHDFRAAAWELFARGQLLPACAKLFSRELVDASGARFSVGGHHGHAFVLSCLRDVERIGVLGGCCYRVSRVFAPSAGDAPAQRGFRRLEEEYTALLGLYRHWGLEGDAASMEMLQSRYLERLVACVEGVCGSASGLSSADQKKTVSSMISTPQAQLAASVAHPESNAARSMLAPIKSHNVTLICAQARLLSRFRRGHAVWAMPDAFV